MENFNSDLPRHLDLLETQNTEGSGDTHALAQESGNTNATSQEPSQETEGASAQETEGISNPTSNQPRRQVRRNPRYYNNVFINIMISKINGHIQNHRSSAITSPFSFKSQKPNQQMDRNLCFLNHMKWNDFSIVFKGVH